MALQIFGTRKCPDTRKAERFKRHGLGYMDFDIEEESLADPLLLKSPIVRDDRRAAVGYRPEVWERWFGP